jgi:hypothetical protein
MSPKMIRKGEMFFVEKNFPVGRMEIKIVHEDRDEIELG